MEILRANLIGSGGLSQFEADVSCRLVAIFSLIDLTSCQTLRQAYKKELHKFDTLRVIVAWDGLISKQQAALESLGVPVMYVSDLTSDREAGVHHFPVSLPSLTFMIAVLRRPLNPTETTAYCSGT